MNLSELKSEVDKDISLNMDSLDVDSLKTPEIHHKYLKIYTEIQINFKSAESKYKICRRDKWEYYSGKGEKPYQEKILKVDIPIIMEGDEELIKYKDKMEYLSVILEYLEGVLKSLNNRNWLIKNAIEYQKFLQGVN